MQSWSLFLYVAAKVCVVVALLSVIVTQSEVTTLLSKAMMKIIANMSPYLHDRYAASGGRFPVGRHIVSGRCQVPSDSFMLSMRNEGST
jgi:hypothetical protein